MAAGSYGPRPGGEGIVEEDGAGGDLTSNSEDSCVSHDYHEIIG